MDTKFYKVIYSGDYSKKKGKYGIIFSKLEFDHHLIEDQTPLAINILKDIVYEFRIIDNSNELADVPLSVPMLRLVSEKMKLILDPFLESNFIDFYPIAVEKDNISFQYYLLHFQKINYSSFIKIEFLNSSYVVTLRKEDLEGIDIFKTHLNDSFYYISERIKTEFEKQKITGISYVDTILI